MHDPGAVRRREGVEDIIGDAERFAPLEWPSPEARRERLALDELEDEARHAAGLEEAMDRGDVWVVERRQQLGLAFEARQTAAVLRDGRWQYFDRDPATQPHVGCAVHLAHPADADQCL